MRKSPLILGHRGVPGQAPENTLAGFELAMAQGADGVELDVHLSRDGELVVIHDELLDRTTDGHGPVGAHSFSELRQFNASAKFAKGFERQCIPTLGEVVEALDDSAFINIELKSGVVLYPGIEERLADFIIARGMVDRVIVSSFNHYSIVELKRIAPEIKVGLLYMAALVNAWEYADSIGADALHPLHYSVRKEFVEASHSCGIMVNPWAPVSENDLRRVISAGVDAVITNVPGDALRIREGV